LTPPVTGPRPVPPPGAAGQGAPGLAFTVEGAEAKIESATPAIDFRLAIDAGGAAVRSLVLDVQVRLAVSARPYGAATRARLSEVLGELGGRGMVGSLFWARVVVTVPPFEGTARIEVPVPCTYDTEVAVAKYFQAVADGTVPVEMLFSGSVFWSEDGALRTARIPWDREARYELPVAVWRRVMDLHFPGASWIRLDPHTFDRLATWKAERSIPTWDRVIGELIDRSERADDEDDAEAPS
jgi:hypothetical protein